ncbi:hypothetical protein QBC42DRAFT_56087 [Cladorrhinum samala]|uniref:Uncharacterized protein n=1 Tax=Cladorrhinum samala TaxID=585594 RepID=A0AAV9HX29_9PEZI|nr:hypothetical protein QBC42DRAFT_56087 [Cladorrhinum samala]
MPAMSASKVGYAFGPDPDRIKNHPRIFKKHKVLPHPRKDVTGAVDLQRPGSGRSVESEAPSLRSARQSKRLARGPEPPPTPPTHSRNPSAAHTIDAPGPDGAGSPADSAESVVSQQPITPPNQETPPTPNLTPERIPPGLAERPAKPRPPIFDRLSSRITIDSRRTESFKTAPEVPELSDGDDDDDDQHSRSTSRPALPSAKTSQSTVRQLNGEAKEKQQVVGLGLGIGLESSLAQDDLTPPTEEGYQTFNQGSTGREAGMISEVVEEWDQNLGRNVMVRKRRPITQRDGRRKREVVVEDLTVTPTKATQALRSMSLQESPVVQSRKVLADRLPAQPAPSVSEASIGSDMKRSSVISIKSTASTVVDGFPHRQKTLRHIRKQSLLRDSCSDLSPSSSTPTSISAMVEDQRRGRSKLGDATRESQASTATFNSISSRTARKEVLKAGGIPVVIVPERRSSVKSTSRPPSLRSTSSRRSQSVGSAPRSQSSKSKDHHVPHFERTRRRSRSESDGSRHGDERTIDYPPVIPSRSSSLSAPTSRNVSRNGSLTADSLRAHNAFQAQQAHQALQKASRELDRLVNKQSYIGQPTITHQRPGPVTAQAELGTPEVLVHRAPVNGWRHENDQDQSSQDYHEDNRERLSSTVDQYGDPFWGKRLSAQHTPFSVASVASVGTSHAEVSEALAVNIYPHQSKSVVLVDHAAKPSESSSVDNYKRSDQSAPTLRLADATNIQVPSTPPQKFSVEVKDVDSPLRNPRSPPKPPAINFIPATPSGLTPMTEKQKMLGNYFEVTGEKQPKRGVSLLRQTLTRRKTVETSEYGPSASRPTGFLARTFSLSRKQPPRLKRSSSADDRPADESRLHPNWRPAYLDYSSPSSSEDEYDEDDDRDRTYKYPPIDNRPSRRYYPPPARRRSLSQRFKRTFAILPQTDDEYYDDEYTAQGKPQRRTIRRTPSGNLRVMKFRRSMESLRRIELVDHGPVSVSGARGDNAEVDQRQPRRQSRFESGVRRLGRSLSLSGRSRSRTRSIGGGVGVNGGDHYRGREEAVVDERPTFGERINLPRRLSERRREKRSQELRKIISGPKEVRDGVGEITRRASWGINAGEVAGKTVISKRGVVA